MTLLPTQRSFWQCGDHTAKARIGPQGPIAYNQDSADFMWHVAASIARPVAGADARAQPRLFAPPSARSSGSPSEGQASHKPAASARFVQEEVSTRILGRRTAPFPPFLISERVPHGFTQDPGTDRSAGVAAAAWGAEARLSTKQNCVLVSAAAALNPPLALNMPAGAIAALGGV